MYRLHTVCRACGYGKDTNPTGAKVNPTNERLIKVADFGLMPLANDFRKPDEEHAGFAPLEVMFCPRCHLAQLSVVVDPKILYHNYPYVTSNTAMMQAHFETIWQDICCRLGHRPDSVLEIGSNDGKFLKFCLGQDTPEVIGIEPDRKLCEQANQAGFPTICTFWPDGDTSASKPDHKHDLIIARHVFAHIDDWQGFMAQAERNLRVDGILFIECPYVGDLLKNFQVDTIYHEHLSYVNKQAVEWLLDDTSLALSDVIHYPIHGGAMGLVIRNDARTFGCAYEEKITPEMWRDVHAETERLVRELRGVGLGWHNFCGYGASAKSTFWIQQCHFNRDEIRFITDDTPAKWYTTSPGSDIPIVDEGALLREMPDYAIMFAWNYEREILERNKLWIEKGGKFIVPVPKLRIVP